MGSYVDGVLARDESIVARGRITNWIWFWPFLLTVLSTGILFPILLIPLIAQRTTELVVTNKRVIAKFGLISRRTIEQRIQKIESIRVDQGIFARLLGFGSIRVHGTGGAMTPIRSISDPFVFKRAVEQVIDDSEIAGRSNETARTA